MKVKRKFMKELPELKSFKNIAIIQTAFLGDVALALYLAETIKQFNINAKLTFVTTPASASFVSCHETIDYVITYDKRGIHSGYKGIRYLAGNLKELKIDCVISPHRSLRTSLLTYFSNAKYSVGFDKNALSFLYNKRINYILGNHEVDRNASLLKAFSDTDEIINTLPSIELNISDDDKSFIDFLLATHLKNGQKQIIALAPGSIWDTKRWPKEYFSELSIKLNDAGFIPVIVGSGKDIAIGKIFEKNNNIINLVGETTLPQLIYLLSISTLLITNDSSPTHFAGLVNCPTLTIYGPTIPEFGFSPKGNYSKSLGIQGLKCRPCSIHGANKCPTGKFDCMKLQTPEKVFKAAMDVLEKIPFE